MGNMLGRFTIVLAALAALTFGVLGVTGASAQTTPDPAVPQAVPPAPGPAPASEPDAAPAAAAGTPQKAPAGGSPAHIGLRLKGLRKGKVTVGNKAKLAGTLRPFAPGEKVTVIIWRGKKTIGRKTLTVKQKPGSKFGKFRFADKMVKPGRYSYQVVKAASANLGAAKARTRSFKIRYPDLDPGNKNKTVQIFNRLLAKQGYVNDEGKKYDSATGRAVLAFHKVNSDKRTENMKAEDFKKLADGRGGYKLKHPKGGKHVEADLSRQVMVLAKGDKVKEIYHVSSGAPATPTVLGHYEFYRKEPGTNNVGMVNSVYFIRGYATHGYPSVPTYPASHGCLRNPIPDSKHIYNWIDIGDDIWVYR